MSSVSSPTLACVQSHRGCASMSSVGRAVSRAIRLSTGQRAGAFAAMPGLLSYAIREVSPATAPPSQSRPNTAQTTGRRRLNRRVARARDAMSRRRTAALGRARRRCAPAGTNEGTRIALCQGLVKIEALTEFAGELLEPVHLLDCLDAFRCHVHFQAGGERDDRADDLGVARLLHAAHERTVDLDRLKRKALQQAQRRRAHPKVVAPELRSERRPRPEGAADGV